ncbi:MAG: DctP family TRAP transporter solute-binding subunit [Oscillospiraceae bacterium]|nr:DctP family TRAP transporter solute-binding subunit [Oscillospiraceae bacterium]
MKKILALALALCMVVALAACGSSNSGRTASGSNASGGDEFNKINLTMTVNGTDTQIDTKVGQKFAELVDEATGGAVKIDVFPNDQLAGGNAAKGMEMLADGSVDIAAYATVTMGALDERLTIGITPWIFDDYTDARNTIDATGLDYYAKILAEQNMTLLGSFHNGFRQLTNAKRPVLTVDDLKGLKIRTPGSAIYQNTFTALGASPSTLNWGEVFTALQQGTIDGQENGLSITNTSGVLEVQPYVTVWSYSYENDLLIFNTDVWNSLNEATQKVLREKALEACNWGRDVVEAEHETLIQEFRDKGIQVDVLTEEQIAPFKERVADVKKDFLAKFDADALAAFGIEG